MRTFLAETRLIAFVIVIAAAILSGCQFEGTPEPLVCIAGYRNNGTNDIPVAWSGTTLGGISAWSDLPVPAGTNPGYANSIAVSGGTIYIAGYRNNGTNDIPVAWSGTTLGGISAWSDLPVPAGTNPGYANSIAVSGGTIYIAGYRNNGTNDIPVAWSGTTLGGISAWSDLPIPAGTNPGYANSIAVSGGTIYIAGYRNNGTNDIPVAWSGTTLGGISAWSDLPVPAGTNPGYASFIAADQ